MDETNGVFLSGPISLSENPEKISMAGGYFRLNPMLLACVGSSSAIPIPVLVDADPILLGGKNGIGQILSDLAGGVIP